MESKAAETSDRSYDELLREFKIALGRVLSGSIMPPGRGIPDGPLTSALLDIAYAARDGRPTNYLVSKACFEFAQFAAAQEATTPVVATVQHLKEVI